MYRNEKNRLLRRLAINTSASIGAMGCLYASNIVGSPAKEILTSVGIGLATLGLAGSIVAQIYNHRLQMNAANYEKDIAASKKAEEEKDKDIDKEEFIPFTYDEILWLTLAGMRKSPVMVSEYPESYHKANLLREYVIAVAYPGYEGMVMLLDSIMEQLKTELDPETLNDYSALISKIEHEAYSKALAFYDLPICEEKDLHVDVLFQKAKALETYMIDTAYYGYEADIDYLYQAIRECEEGNITPENFDDWLHFIGAKAYASVLEECPAR